MKRTARLLAAATITLTCVIGPTASAADSTPLTYDQLLVDPAFQATNGAVVSLMAGDFTMAGKQTNASGKVLVNERITHRGALYRTWIKKSGKAYAIITDGKRTCTRRVTKSAPDSYAADLRARWSCKKGSDPLTTSEVAAMTPQGVAQVLDSTTSGAARYIPTAVSAGSGGVQVAITKPDGTPVGSYAVTGTTGGPFALSVTAGVGSSAYQSVAFTTTAGATDKIPAFGKLRT